jgi:hypothetical protein
VVQVPAILQLGSVELFVVHTAFVTAHVPLVVHCALVWHAVVAGFGLVHVPLNVQLPLLVHELPNVPEFWQVLPVPVHCAFAVQLWPTGSTQVPAVQSAIVAHVWPAGALQVLGRL